MAMRRMRGAGLVASWRHTVQLRDRETWDKVKYKYSNKPNILNQIRTGVTLQTQTHI